eukprot:1638718-Pyramimonas_sp.AAC.1
MAPPFRSFNSSPVRWRQPGTELATVVTGGKTWICNTCGCRHNKLAWWFCKHCKATRANSDRAAQ